MSIQNILMLAVFMTIGTCNIIQAEIIRGMYVPRVNVSRILGKWYRLTASSYNLPYTCLTIEFEEQIDGYLTGRASYKRPSGDFADTLYTVTFEEDSSTMIVSDEYRNSFFETVFDVDYDSYMIVYTTYIQEDIRNGDYGDVYIYGRDKTMPNGVIQKAKQSVFYKRGVESNYEIRLVDQTGCP